MNTYFVKILQDQKLQKSKELSFFSTAEDTFPKSKDFTKKTDFWSIKSKSEDNEDDIDTIHKFLNKRISNPSGESPTTSTPSSPLQEKPEKKQKKNFLGFLIKSKQDLDVDSDDEEKTSKFMGNNQTFDLDLEEVEDEKDEVPMYLVYLHSQDQDFIKFYLNHTMGYYVGETVIGKIEYNKNESASPEFKLLHTRLIESTKSSVFFKSDLKYHESSISCPNSPTRFKYQIPISSCYGNFNFNFQTEYDTSAKGFCGLQLEKESSTKIKNIFGLLQSKATIPFLVYPKPVPCEKETKDYFCLDKLYSKYRLQVKTYSTAFPLGRNTKISFVWNNYHSSFPLSIFEITLIQKLDLIMECHSKDKKKTLEFERRLNFKERTLLHLRQLLTSQVVKNRLFIYAFKFSCK